MQTTAVSSRLAPAAKTLPARAPIGGHRARCAVTASASCPHAPVPRRPHTPHSDEGKCKCPSLARLRASAPRSRPAGHAGCPDAAQDRWPAVHVARSTLMSTGGEHAALRAGVGVLAFYATVCRVLRPTKCKFARAARRHLHRGSCIRRGSARRASGDSRPCC